MHVLARANKRFTIDLKKDKDSKNKPKNPPRRTNKTKQKGRVRVDSKSSCLASSTNCRSTSSSLQTGPTCGYTTDSWRIIILLILDTLILLLHTYSFALFHTCTPHTVLLILPLLSRQKTPSSTCGFHPAQLNSPQPNPTQPNQPRPEILPRLSSSRSVRSLSYLIDSLQLGAPLLSHDGC